MLLESIWEAATSLCLDCKYQLLLTVERKIPSQNFNRTSLLLLIKLHFMTFHIDSPRNFNVLQITMVDKTPVGCYLIVFHSMANPYLSTVTF